MSISVIDKAGTLYELNEVDHQITAAFTLSETDVGVLLDENDDLLLIDKN